MKGEGKLVPSDDGSCRDLGRNKKCNSKAPAQESTVLVSSTYRGCARRSERCDKASTVTLPAAPDLASDVLSLLPVPVEEKIEKPSDYQPPLVQMSVQRVCAESCVR